MAGLRKSKKYDWKDSNLALFGSDLEKNIKKESAKGEPVWENAGTKVGLQIWRIVDFKVTHWPKSKYGQFYDGDSYIILNTYKKDPKSDALSYDVHFWIGRYSSQDEYGTAAYKTVELDTLLDDKPIQHREVMNHESELFKSYFKEIIYLNGGADSGFKIDQPESYKPRLLEFRKVDNKMYVTEKPLKKSSISNGDVYLIDMGLTVIQWNGKDSSPFERIEAQKLQQKLESDRNGKVKSEVLDEQDINNLDESLRSVIPDSGPPDEEAPTRRQPFEKVLNRLSDSSGQLKFTEVSRGSHVKRSQLCSDDVFILETETECFVWTGKGASIEERKKCMQYAHHYVQRSVNPFNPITVVKEGNETDNFNRAFN
ncbi:gelsolin-like protein 1 [Actinia tenebrosa]|uniref:Gelsolin-like protein 1 n=1 Tax=Actinia tenebrosa TaxID=6105 RepID=A0A6P8IEX9_ACTTE|nr:gelsolin-like protein 1 [Actinia tenebrosa]